MPGSTLEPNIYLNNLRNRLWCQTNSKQCWGLPNNNSRTLGDLPWKRSHKGNWDLSARETRWWRIATEVRPAPTVIFHSIKIITWWPHPNLMVAMVSWMPQLSGIKATCQETKTQLLIRALPPNIMELWVRLMDLEIHTLCPHSNNRCYTGIKTEEHIPFTHKLSLGLLQIRLPTKTHILKSL